MKKEFVRNLVDHKIYKYTDTFYERFFSEKHGVLFGEYENGGFEKEEDLWEYIASCEAVE
jgi:hypothetical protein